MEARLSTVDGGICLIPDTQFEDDLIRHELKNAKLTFEFDKSSEGFTCLIIKREKIAARTKDHGTSHNKPSAPLQEVKCAFCGVVISGDIACEECLNS